jgi:hypothetical protein
LRTLAQAIVADGSDSSQSTRRSQHTALGSLEDDGILDRVLISVVVVDVLGTVGVVDSDGEG